MLWVYIFGFFFLSREGEHGAGNLVLRVRRLRADSVKGLVKKFGHKQP